MRNALSFLFLSSLFYALAAEQAPPQAEQQLRARADAFNKLLVTEKYREAEQFVLPESRDTYYTAEKPRIMDFEIKKIDWENHFQAATLEMSSNVMIRKPTIGAFQLKTAYYSHWKFENGDWWYYYPKVMERQTPFGMMKVNPELAKESGLDINSEIAKGKAEMAQARRKTFSADKSSVTLPDKNSSETIILSNLLPGPIKLGFQRISGTGYDVVLKAGNLGPKGTAELTIYRSPGNKAEFKPGSIVVRSFPTGQTMPILVN